MQKLTFLFIGGFFTFILFVGMNFLIKPELQNPQPTTNTTTYVHFNIDDKPPKHIIRVLPKKIIPKEMPESERAIVSRIKPTKRSLITETGIQFSTTGIKVAMGKKIGTIPWGSSTGMGSGLQPTIRINPTYPIPAARNNIEGFVTLNFDISKTGKPINIKIAKAKPRGYFEKSARRALKKWKFSPEQVNKGVDSQQVTLVFKLEDEA